jgi:hypothetical protein
MSSKYVSICSKYGKWPFYIANFVVPWGAIACDKPIFGLTLYLGVGASVLGAELFLPDYLNKKKYGLTRGSKILRRTQFACVAAGICAGGVLQIAADRREYLHKKPHAQITSQTSDKYNGQEAPEKLLVADAQPVRAIKTNSNTELHPII